MWLMIEAVHNYLKSYPSSTARDIATALRLDRPTLNRLLHDEKEFFWQGADFGWRIALPDELVVELCEGWLTATDFETWLSRARSPLDSACTKVVFVLKDGCRLLLDGLSRLLAMCNQLAAARKHVVLDVSDAKGSATYFDRIGFFDVLSDEVDVVPKRPSGSRSHVYRGNNDAVIELRSIDMRSADDEIPLLLHRSFVSLAGESYSQAAFTLLSELYKNVVEHSSTPTPGFAGLQAYAGKKKHIQAVISDNGKGIVGTLLPTVDKKHPALSRKIKKARHPGVALLTEVFDAGHLSSVNSPGRGLGLYSSGRQASKFNANVSVRQEDFDFRLVYSDAGVQFSHFTGLRRLDGTHICFDFLLDRMKRSG